MKLTLERPDPDVVTAVTRSADLLRDGCGLLLDLVDRAETQRGREGVNFAQFDYSGGTASSIRCSNNRTLDLDSRAGVERRSGE